MNKQQAPVSMEEIIDDRFYKVSDLQSVLENLGLNYSIYTIRDYETFKCLNYECARRYQEEQEKCPRCGGVLRAPIIDSPRTRGGGKGVGHRRYTGAEMKKIIKIFKERR